MHSTAPTGAQPHSLARRDRSAERSRVAQRLPDGMTVVAMFLLGTGIGACGLVERDMYVVGAVLIFIALVGAAVRIGEALRPGPPVDRDGMDG